MRRRRKSSPKGDVCTICRGEGVVNLFGQVKTCGLCNGRKIVIVLKGDIDFVQSIIPDKVTERMVLILRHFVNLLDRDFEKRKIVAGDFYLDSAIMQNEIKSLKEYLKFLETRREIENLKRIRTKKKLSFPGYEKLFSP